MMFVNKTLTAVTALIFGKMLLVFCLAFLLFIYTRRAHGEPLKLTVYPLQVQVIGEKTAERPITVDNYSYRRANDKKTIGLMLYGFHPQTDEPGFVAPQIAKDRKSLTGFFKQHWDNVKREREGQDPDSLRLITGQASFTSRQLNRTDDFQPAKMAGFTIPMGVFTLGGGYTWGEKNPAMMMRTKPEGLMLGASYDTGKTGFQISYLSSGQSVGGFRIGGTSTRYDSLMFGTSWRMTERVGLTTTLQYRRDNDQLTTGDRQVIFTVGTRWKF